MTAAAPLCGLHDLEQVELPPGREAWLDEALAASAGPSFWRARKRAEAKQLLALEQVAPRLDVRGLQLHSDLFVLLEMAAAVPCLEPGGTELEVATRTRLLVRYPIQVLRASLPGTAFVEIVEPEAVWHPNVQRPLPRRLCLGTHLPVGMPLVEIVLATYGALTLQSVQVDERDAAGVMNVAAACWWQQRLDRIPLSDEPFLGRAAAASALEKGVTGEGGGA